MNTLSNVSDLEPQRPDVNDQVSGCVRAPWRLLAVVPTERSLSAMRLVDALAYRCNAASPAVARAFCAEGLSKEGVMKLVDEMKTYVHNGGRAVVGLEAMGTRRSGAPIAIAADAVLLCVHLGQSTLASARGLIELVGADRFIGAVTLEPERPSGRP